MNLVGGGTDNLGWLSCLTDGEENGRQDLAKKIPMPEDVEALEGSVNDCLFSSSIICSFT
jgi:hypothetical protein